MNYLLDTHVFIWLDNNPSRLSPQVQSICRNAQNSLFVSLVSLWEMQIKTQLGKLALKMPLREMISHQLQSNQISFLPVTISHILNLENLPLHHRDPFDRLLVSQCQVERLTFLTDDSQLSNYMINLIW